MIRAGDVVNDPSVEENDLVVAAVSPDGEWWAWAGWPPGVAPIAGARLVSACTDSEHVLMCAGCRGLSGERDGYLDRRAAWSRGHRCDTCSGGSLS